MALGMGVQSIIRYTRIQGRIGTFSGSPPRALHSAAFLLYILVLQTRTRYFIEEEKNGIGSKDVNTAMLICGVISPVIGSVILQNRLNAVAVAKSERAEEDVSLEASIA